MNLQERIDVFAHWGERIKEGLKEGRYTEVFRRAQAENGWFTPENQITALEAIASYYLDYKKLQIWLAPYKLENNPKPATIAIIMAGNIPLAGFHDLLTVLAMGYRAQIKTSSKDDKLPRLVVDELLQSEPRFRDYIVFADKLAGFDAVIATGSNNTFRYFQHYFGQYPHLLRSSRSSVAVLKGNESRDQLEALGRDIFTYFGLGCRSVSKLYLPNGYDLVPLFEALETFKVVMDHNKYLNNYDYNKSIYLLNQEPHYDTGFLLLRESEALSSPTAVVYFEYYEDAGELAAKLALLHNNLQCVVGAEIGEFSDLVPFGLAQQPELWDYADRVNTVKVLQEILP